MDAAQQPPDAAPGLAQFGHQLWRHLTHRLGLARQLRQIVAVKHLAPARTYPGVGHTLVHANQADLIDIDISGRLEPRPARGHRVASALHLHQLELSWSYPVSMDGVGLAVRLSVC